VDLSLVKQRLVKGDAQGTADGTRDALAEEVPAETILNEALIAGMEEVGDLFAVLVGSGYEPAGKVIMGTVEGDLHDIGKRLVGVMLEGIGFEVLDLGANVSSQRFVEAAKESGARLVGLSSLLTTTLPAMEETVRAFRKAELEGEVRIMIGGAPVTESFAQQIGADGYAPDASAAAVLARRLVGLPARQSDAP
jgi:5-methyltetrahydrofolate--homocysteine methyltransferase